MDLSPQERRFKSAGEERLARQRRMYDGGRNGEKRRWRADVATLKGQPGGWKKQLRLHQQLERDAERLARAAPRKIVDTGDQAQP